ncbi:MAG: DHA2 family efflux MFS transporter permease subunit [Frankiaceae bacterium]|nr:DHA2 family efflux MFS transporter permease subunit [Frankiaceae bacterium]
MTVLEDRPVAIAPTEVAPMAAAPDRRRWLILGVLTLAQLMVVLDATVVNIALPVAQHALGFSDGGRQWVVTAYALAFGSLLLLGGRLSDVFGRRTVLLVGVAGFAVASAVGGFATTYTMLVVARAAQGVFGALLAPAALAMLTTTFTDDKERAKAFGIFGAVAGAGSGVGLLLGGALTEYASWRWCLNVNIVVAVMAIAGVFALIPHDRPNLRSPLDLPGTATVTAGLVGIVYGFAHADSAGWTDPITLACLVAGVALVGAFVAIERRVSNPLLPMRVVLNRTRGGAYVAFSLLGIGMFGTFLFLTYYLQSTLGFSPVKSGLAFLPMIGALLVSANVATAVLEPRFSTRSIMATGMGLAAVGVVLLTGIGVTTSYGTHVVPGLVVAGLGFGMVFAPGMNAATRGVLDSDAGVASAMMNVTQQVGGSIGTALLNTVATSAAASFVTSHAPSTSLVAQAAVHSYAVAFWCVAGIFAAGAVITGLLLDGKDTTVSPEDVRSRQLVGVG